MTVALTFAAPLLLIGLSAAGLPFLLHLLSTARARQVRFPTLQLLRVGMERTARRRRIQHWLLLILRSVLLGLLAIAAAEPISRLSGGWLSGRRYAAVVILDNSMSMAVRRGQVSRFDRARAAAGELLSGDDKPALAAVMTTNGGWVSKELTADLGSLREAVAVAAVGYGRASIAQRVAAAAEMLEAESVPQKAIFIFSDLQRVSFDELASLRLSDRLGDVHLLIVDFGAGRADNVGITGVEVAHRPVVGQPVQLAVSLVNSSAADRVVDVTLSIDSQPVGRRIRRTLGPAGTDADSATVRFYHRFTQPGDVNGEVALVGRDDLEADDVRRFAFSVGGRVAVLVVQPPSQDGDFAADPAGMLRLALSPYRDPAAPWPIALKVVEAGQLAEQALAEADAAFFCGVPSFTPSQARAIGRFVRRGGTAAFFLGRSVRAENYNELFIDRMRADGGLLPLRLGEPTGQLGPLARAVPLDWVDTRHKYFERLYEDQSEYLTVLVQRYFRLSQAGSVPRVLMRLANGDPLMASKRFGRGQAVLFATSASPEWSNLPATGLFLPMVVRMSLLSRTRPGDRAGYEVGSTVPIRLGRDVAAPAGQPPVRQQMDVTLPPDAAGEVRIVSVPLRAAAEGYLAEFSETERPGVYRWELLGGPEGPDASGVFAVNPAGEESRLSATAPEQLRRVLAKAGLRKVYAAETLAGTKAIAAAEARGRNWWDVLIAAAVVLLIIEIIVANRREPGPAASPAPAA